MTLLDIFQYGFAVRGLEAGLVVGFVAPLIGIFLVLRRYSLIADTLAHVSLAGIAFGFLVGVSPFVSALAVTLAASLGIERLRESKRVYGESALAISLSGALALATVLISIGNGFNASVFNYLFGSIVTVTQSDVYAILVLGIVVCAAVALLYKELVFISFDEVAAQVAGIPVRRINLVLILLSALTIALAIPIVGVLLIAALIVIPVTAALQLRLGFMGTLVVAEVISLISVLAGIFISFSFDIATGGTIVLVMLAVFLVLLFTQKRA